MMLKLITILFSTFWLLSRGPGKSAVAAQLMDQMIVDSLSITLDIGKCVLPKGKNLLTFHLKNNSHSTLTVHANIIVPGPITDSTGDDISPISRIFYRAGTIEILVINSGAAKDVSYESSYFSYYGLKTGQYYFVSGFYASSNNTDGHIKGPTVKFSICD
jgi:hypothetical protein